MGACCSKEVPPNDVYMPSVGPAPSSITAPESPEVAVPICPKIVVDSAIIDRLILELLSLIASFVDNEDESPVSLVKLHSIADKEDGWIQIITSMVHVIPLEDPLGPSAITIVFDDCPLPSKDSVIKLTQIFGLSSFRAMNKNRNVRVERNICVVLGCIADKLAGPNSMAVLTDETLDYLISFLLCREEMQVTVFALIALEKFAQTTENKLIIKGRLEVFSPNPLLELERLSKSDDYSTRQVGFCAKWTLDNVFVVEGRLPSFQTAKMSRINAMLNKKDVSEYLKISCDGLEARCDSYSFESVRCTFPIDDGIWYYEVTIVTPGVMQIGWATRNSHFLNHEGYGIGDDLYSLSYDGCRKFIWYEAKPRVVTEVEAWQPGDVVGCLLDMQAKVAIFSLNGKRLRACTDIFKTTREGFFAAASFMAFQQCIFNFGHVPFKFPPTDREFQCFNDHACLSDEEKQIVPRRIYLQTLQYASVKEDSCVLCYDNTACCVLEKCMHRGFCSLCTAKLRDCPLCRSTIVNVLTEK